LTPLASVPPFLRKSPFPDLPLKVEPFLRTAQAVVSADFGLSDVLHVSGPPMFSLPMVEFFSAEREFVSSYGVADSPLTGLSTIFFLQALFFSEVDPLSRRGGGVLFRCRSAMPSPP